MAVGKGTPTTSYGALAARQAVALFDPKYVAFLGVGGGFALDDQGHGDVAVSSVVVGYEYGKVDTGGFSPRGDFTYRGDEGLIRVAEAAISRGEAWWRAEDNVGRSPRARTGMIASGDKLIDDPDESFFAAVRARWPKLLAVEMEGAGVAAAMHEAQADHRGGRFVLVRGISDMPHAKVPGEGTSTGERDAWKRIASRNAARFLAHLITAWWPVPPRARPSSAGEDASHAAYGSGERFTVGPAGFWRYILDRLAPRLHGWLRHIGAVETPPEYADITAYMRELKALLEQDIADRTKAYVPLHARTVPRAPAAADDDDDQFVRPIHQVIRVILGSLEGGDVATAELAMVNRQSRVVRNLMRTLRNATEPLILLGDPGTGKSMTLQRVACAMIEAESRRVFPMLTLYVPLGEFHVAGSVSHHDVLAHVRDTLPPEVRRWVDALDRAGRLMILFDGMDEMSRERYTEHTEALSAFAGSRPWCTRTLFSCRITDFSPRFTHRRYVLVPFNRGQILSYLRDYFRSAGEPVIEGERWPLRRLARRLAQRDLPVDASNPFVLWLLCHHLSESGRWPSSRIELLRNFLDKTYDRKRARRGSAGEREEDPAWPGQTALEAALAELAFLITERNRGRVIAVEEWTARAAETEDAPAVISVGRTLGILAESKDAGQVRFDHHRLQEYFTALHLCRAQASVAWLDKLDVPRWQEVMINLVLLGHGEVAVRVLADELGEAVDARVAAWAEFEAEVDRRREQGAAAPEQTAASADATPDVTASEAGEANATASEAGEASKAASKDAVDAERTFPVPLVEPLLTASEEILLGDRTELASRLVREASICPAVTEHLQPVLRRAVGVLIEKGNPVTQVKMMRASVHLADPELHAAMRPLLASDIAWVRAQALILLAEGQREMGVNLASEIGFDLARGSLVASLPSYVKAIVRSHQAGAAWSLIVGVAASVMQLALFVAIAAAVYGSVHAWQIWERLFG
ncbi:MAG TPA: NACHT domain-containing protein, partial [Kofleriaceae bacterium]|nr:NACHT domain-containing protein [Kofleriaceae bacterium]